MSKSKLDRTRQETLDVLAELGGQLSAEDDIVFEGDRLVIPERMKMQEAITFLAQKLDSDESTMTFSETFNFRPWDGARATMAALKKTFGMVIQQGTPTFFGEKPPQLITVKTGVDTEEQVPWGAVEVPHLPECRLYLGQINHPELGPLFQIAAEGPRKLRHHIQGLFSLVAEELKVNSLYRGKAFDGQTMPEFLDLSGVHASQVIYSNDVTRQLEANVWSLLRYTPRLRELGVPLKRAVLFEGPYGTGKTLGAYLTAQVATDNGWTFIYCRPSKDHIGEVIATARLYQPSVVFFEDVDSIASSDVGSDGVSQLLDVFDGLQSKGTEILAVLTTNHVSRIHKAMTRPGRLDAVIHIGALDLSGPERMALATVPGELLDPSTDWNAVGHAMEGFLPAFVRETLGRAVRYNLARNDGEPSRLGTEDFIDAAEGLRPQLELMEKAKDEGRTDTLGDQLRQAVREAVDGTDILDVDDGMLVQRLQTNGQK